MMKNLFILAIFCLLASASPVSADNYFSLRTETTTPDDGNLRIPPYFVGTDCQMYATANFDGYLDHWFVQITYPKQMRIRDEVAGTDMSLPYTMINGTDTICDVILTTNEMNIANGINLKRSSFSATSTVFGYWDSNNDGYYEQYGTVKWEPGFHNEMIQFNMHISDSCLVGDISITGTLTSTTDFRGVLVVSYATFNKTIHYWVGYRPGDISGDDIINIGDLAMLQTLLLQGPGDLDQFQLAAADVNGDGVLNISDITALTDLLVGVNGLEDELLQ